jgi:excisionase family DNA binding protein
MSPTLLQEAEELHRALANRGPSVKVSLSRDTAELVARVIDAKAAGKEILVARGFQEVSPTEAASILGMSRPQVRKVMDSGRLPFRMVGTHHRIAVSDLQDFMTAERSRRKEAMKAFAALENELGLFE